MSAPLSWLVPLLVLGWPPGLNAQAQSVCRSADAATAEAILDLRRDMERTDPLSQRGREIAHLPTGPDVPIVVVSEEALCRQARAAYVANTRSYDRTTGQWNTPTARVYVLRVDTLYYVWDPETMMGEYQLVTTLDAHFNALANMMR